MSPSFAVSGMVGTVTLARGKPMAVLAHGTVGLQHAAMAVYNAWCDRVPVLIFGGNGVNAATRRPGVEWYHSAQDPAAFMRDFVKWDDQPASLQHFANPFPLAAFQYQMRKPRLDMPAYIEKWVSDQDVADMYAYLLSLKPAPAAKDIPLLNR